MANSKVERYQKRTARKGFFFDKKGKTNFNVLMFNLPIFLLLFSIWNIKIMIDNEAFSYTKYYVTDGKFSPKTVIYGEIQAPLKKWLKNNGKVLTYPNEFLVFDTKFSTYKNIFSIFNGDILPLTYQFYQPINYKTAVLSYFPLLIYLIFLYSYYIAFKRALFARTATQIGLDNYRILKKSKDKYIFKLRRNEENNFNYVQALEEDIKQALHIKDFIQVIFARHRKFDILMQVVMPFNINLEDEEILLKMKKGKIFFGQSLEENKKLEWLYININDFQRSAILGTSGGGKSNTINTILYSIFFNLELYNSLFIIDFKGGIEATPVKTACDEIDFKMDIATSFESALPIFQNLKKINSQREEQNRKLGLKKTKEKIIYIIIDEIAEMLGDKPQNKEEKEMQSEILSILGTLFRKGRSQKIYILYATQSYVGNSSGLTASIKSNTTNRILLKTEEQTSIQSVFSLELLKKLNLFPQGLNKGEAIAKFDNFDKPIKLKTPLISDEVTDTFIQVSKMGGYKKVITKNKEKNLKNEVSKNKNKEEIKKDTKKDETNQSIIKKDEAVIFVNANKIKEENKDIEYYISKRKLLWNYCPKLLNDEAREVKNELRKIKKEQEQNKTFCIEELQKIINDFNIDIKL